MQIHVYDHAQQVGQAAATLLAAQLISKPNSVLGLATGSSPIPTYQELIRLHRAGVVYRQEHREDGVLLELRADERFVKNACKEGARLLSDEQD